AQRFSSAADLAFHLRSVNEGIEEAPPPRERAAQSIAILPFANGAGDPDAQYLCEGITECILNSLARVPQLRVVPRSTVFRYDPARIDPLDAGRELKVSAVLTGRVTQRLDRLIVSAELLDVASGKQVWGERYNRKLADIFDVEEDLARSISSQLRVQLAG